MSRPRNASVGRHVIGAVGPLLLGLLLGVALPPASPAATPPSEEASALGLLPIAIMVGRQTPVESTLVVGAENGEAAVAFAEWLVPLDALASALQIHITELDDQRLEFVSPAFVVRVAPALLRHDPRVGRAMRVADIESTLHVPLRFDLSLYAIVIEPQWCPAGTRGRTQVESPVILEGLPRALPGGAGLTSVDQVFSLQAVGDAVSQRGSTVAVGRIGSASWYLRADELDLQQEARFRLQELQLQRLGDAFDLVGGSQQPFWQSPSAGDYWGGTLVYRSGFSAPPRSSGGFDPATRMESTRGTRTIRGLASPGTLVRLVDSGGARVDEQLVDATGEYQFAGVSTDLGTDLQGYRIELYADGLTGAEPEIRRPTFDTRAGRLERGASAWVVSAGGKRLDASNSWGEAGSFAGGIAYRHGLSDDFTLGFGVVEDEDHLLRTELVYQPAYTPLALFYKTQYDLETSSREHVADLYWALTERLNLTLNSTPHSNKALLNWRAAPLVQLFAQGNSYTESWGGGFQTTLQRGERLATLRAEHDSRAGERWELSGYWYDWSLSAARQAFASRLQVQRNLSGHPRSDLGQLFTLGRETREADGREYSLEQVGWAYRSQARGWDTSHRLRVELAYGRGTAGEGLLALLTTALIPGLNLSLDYQGVSVTSGERRLFVRLSASARSAPHLDVGQRQPECLRDQGGLFIEPFIDKDGDGLRGTHEPLLLDDIALLLRLNNRPVPRQLLQVTSRGVYLHLYPGTYRLDLDPAGYPIGGEPQRSAFAATVSAGGYTTISVPFSSRYTVAGVVSDAQGVPLHGVTIRAQPAEGDGLGEVVTQSRAGGVYFLDNLRAGRYRLSIDGQVAEPQWVSVNMDAESIIEQNLHLPRAAGAE